MKRISLAIAAALVMALAGASYGTTYYVSTSGNDGWPGSQAQPWATLQHAVDTIAAGDTILVTPGTYAGCRIRYSGSSGAPKTLAAQTVGTVLINQPGALCRRPSNIEVISDDYGTTATEYWAIDGFETANSPKWGIDGINADHLTVSNCVAHGSVVTGIFSAFGDYNLIEDNVSYSNGEHGYYVNNSSDNGVLSGNIGYSNVSLGIHMNGDASMGGDGIMSNWLLERNRMYSNGSNGFDGDGVDYSVWKNNLAYDNASKGIHLVCADGAVNPRYDRVINNTLITKVGAYYCLTFFKSRKVRTGGNNNTAMNNILYNYDINNTMRGSIMYVSGWMSTFTSNYNVVVNRFAVDDNKTKYTLAQWQALGKDLNSTLCLDASLLFVNHAGFDFHLKTGSPAVNAGTVIADVTDDLDGNPRPVGAYDCGCYELQ